LYSLLGRVLPAELESGKGGKSDDAAIIAAEIGSQRLPDRSVLPALRSIFSDLSNLLLSSVIVHSIRRLAVPARAASFSRALPVYTSRHRRGVPSAFGKAANPTRL